MKVLALDYGVARTGVAVSDATGTLARPVGVVERAGTAAGLARIVELVARRGAELVVVGLPLTLRGERGEQARGDGAIRRGAARGVDVPVESFDERFTTALAAQRGRSGAARMRGPRHISCRAISTWASGAPAVTRRRSERRRRRPCRGQIAARRVVALVGRLVGAFAVARRGGLARLRRRGRAGARPPTTRRRCRLRSHFGSSSRRGSPGGRWPSGSVPWRRSRSERGAP